MLKKSTCTSHCNEVRSAMRSYLDVLLACTERVGDAHRVGAIFIARTLNDAHEEMCAVFQTEYVATLYRSSVVIGPPAAGAVVDMRQATIGPGGIDPTLAAALGAWLEAAVILEPSSMKNGVCNGRLGEPRFKYGDIIASTSIERMQSALRMMELHMGRMDHEELPHQTPWSSTPGTQPLPTSLTKPSSLAEARKWLITPVRLLGYLSLKGTAWAQEAIKVGNPVPVWHAPAGSGYPSHYELGELYDFLCRHKPESKSMRLLALDAQLTKILVPPSEAAELAKKAVDRQSGRKRSKARSSAQSPF